MFDHFRRSDGSKTSAAVFVFVFYITDVAHLTDYWIDSSATVWHTYWFLYSCSSLIVCLCVWERETACVRADRCLWICLSLCVCVGDVCVGSVVFYSVMVSRSTAQLVFSVGVAAEQRPPPGLAEWPSVCSACRLIHHCGNTDRTKGHAGMRKIRVCSLSSGCINVHACLRDPCTRRLCIAGVWSTAAAPRRRGFNLYLSFNMLHSAQYAQWRAGRRAAYSSNRASLYPPRNDSEAKAEWHTAGSEPPLSSPPQLASGCSSFHEPRFCFLTVF